jgi:hypothetical protein
VEPPLKKMKLFGNAFKDLTKKFIKTTFPVVDESNKFINFSYCPLISNNSQLQLVVDMPSNTLISS